MSARFSVALLFVVLFVAFPLPMLGLEASVPAARFAQIATVAAVLAIAEGTQGMVGILAGLFAAHAVGYAVLLGLSSWALGRYALARLHHRMRDHVIVIFSVLLMSIAAYGELYDSRFHHSSAHANLLELYR